MTRAQLLAAEIFKYSFADYQDHLGIGNQRFERLMPRTAELLEQAVAESWPVARLASELNTDPTEAAEYLHAYHEAVAVVDSATPADAFRNAVSFVIRDAVDEGLRSSEDIDRLVRQVCYRVSDLSYLLDLEEQPLSRYSRHLRRDPDVEYYDGYFEEGGH